MDGRDERPECDERERERHTDADSPDDGLQREREVGR